MKALRLSIVFPLCSVLFACGSAPVQSVDQKQIDQTVRQAIRGKSVIKESLLRDGETVSLAVRLMDDGDKPDGEIYLRADCASGKADWVYADILNKKASPARKERRYADGTSLYAPPHPLDESDARGVQQLDAVKQACERVSSWREVAYNKKNDTQLLLDVSSLQTQEDGSVRFWAAVDYPHIAYIRLYKAPYARRAGFYQADCQKQSYSLLHVYYLDPQQTITDGGMQARPPVLKIPQATGDSVTLLSAVCGQEDLAQSLLPPEPRSKRLPNFSALPEPLPNIVGQLGELKRVPPKLPINGMNIEGTRSSLTGSAAARLNKSGFFRQEVFIEPTQTPGVFHVTWQEGDDRTEQIGFLGMIPVSQMAYSAEEQSVSRVARLELRGDWANMPVNSQLGYWQREQVTNLMTNQSNRDSEVICKVVRSLPAEELHKQFQGTAKELKCHVVGGKIDEISTYYYLEDYGFGFLLGSRSPKYSLNSHVTEVR
ncbi:MAG: hypothetical protein LBU76_03385 [Azoarcus sp.]|nr:hypothetical protein [Azoarcus sp.]